MIGAVVAALAAAVRARRPRWHRTPALAPVRPVEAPVERRYAPPGEDRVLAALARRGGDLPAHRAVHLTRKETTHG